MKREKWFIFESQSFINIEHISTNVSSMRGRSVGTSHVTSVSVSHILQIIGTGSVPN